MCVSLSRRSPANRNAQAVTSDKRPAARRSCWVRRYDLDLNEAEVAHPRMTHRVGKWGPKINIPLNKMTLKHDTC